MQGFLHCVWSPRMPYSVAEKGGGKKKKKVGKPIGDPVRGRDAPMTTTRFQSITTMSRVMEWCNNRMIDW